MTPWRSSLLVVLTFPLFLLAGCPDNNGDTGGCKTGDFVNCPIPQIDFQPPGDRVEISDSGLALGETREYKLRVINVGEKVLKLEDIELEYEPPAGAKDGATPAFTLGALPDLPAQIQPFGGPDFPQGVDLRIIFTKGDDALRRNATLSLVSNDPLNEKVTIEVTTEVGVPAIAANPNPVSFGLVPRSEDRVYRTLNIINQGSVELKVGGFEIRDDARFGVRGASFEIEGPEALEGISLDEALIIPPGEFKPVEVSFLSDSARPAAGKLVIFSDDPDDGTTGYFVNLEANKDGPCIDVEPPIVQFGGKAIGSLSTIIFRISSCGTEPLSVRDVAFKSGASPDFTLDFSTLPGGMVDGPTASNPLVVPVGEKVDVGVIFVPDSVNPRDADNVPIPDEATIEIASNAFESKVEVDVLGSGADSECPTPVIIVKEGEEVIPQTVIHLDARQSTAPFGEIRSYFWKITKWPDGTPRPTMIPSFTDPQPNVELNVVGEYVFELSVQDELGGRSGTAACPDAQYTVLVQPDQAIHVELTWVTPGDVDETDTGDGKGTDLDLHFAHQNAIGPDIDGDGAKDPWFDKDWDVFWWNKEPGWGNFDPNAQDDPSLDRDDVDGAGPENLSLNVPEDQTTYRIGVHFWNDWKFGPVDATVKVYHYADLVYTAEFLGLAEWDMWCVGEIHWPTVGVQRCAEEGAPERFAPNYINPFFRPPTFR